MSSYWIEKEVKNAKAAIDAARDLSSMGMHGLAEINAESAGSFAKQAATYAFFIHPDMRSRDHVPNR